MWIAVAQQPGKRSEVHAIRNEIECLHSRRRHPLIRQEAGVYPRRYRRNARGLAIDRDLGLAKICVAAAIDLIDAGEIVGKASKPLFVNGLALRDYIHVHALNVHRKGERSRELVCRTKQERWQI